MSNFLKNCGPNILAWIIEFVLIAIYFVIGFEGIIEAFEDLDFEAMFEAVEDAIIFLTIATFVVAVCFLAIKPLRTKTTVYLAIMDLIWVASNVYYIATEL